MKRVLCFLLATALLFSFSACRSVKVGSDLQPTSGLETNETDPTSQTETTSNGGLDASPTTKATKATKKTKATKATKSTKATKATSAVSATSAPVCEPTEAPVTEAIVIPMVAPTEIPTVQTTAAPTTKATKATKATKVTKATKATSAQTVATEPEGTKHIHSYTAKIVEATCLLDGYTEHICACGDRYVDTYTKKTNDHEFASTMIQKSNGGAYPTTQCKKCKLEVFNHGYCGEFGEGKNFRNVKFYITYDGVTEYPGDQEDKYHLVIYGEGAIRSYEGPNAELPTWYDDLELRTTRITIEEGVTEIGSYSFYAPDSRHEITIEMADSVKIIRKNAIYLKKMNKLILGKGVERIEGDIFRDNVTRVYLPRSLKYIEKFARTNSAGKDVVYYYEGTQEEFLNIKNSHYGDKITMQERLESFYSSGGTRFCTVYLNCAKLLDKHDYFDMYAVFGK